MRVLPVMCVAGAVAVGTPLIAAEPSAAEPLASRLQWHGGGDIRIRKDWLSDLPSPDGPSKLQDYWRFRTRLSGRVEDPGRWSFNVRLTHEFFEYRKPKNSRAYHWPEELLVDNLYLEVKNLFDGRVDIRIGRQDVTLGAGRLFQNGTPGDGPRTAFIDAIRITHRLSDRLKADYLGIYNSPHADLTIGRAHGVPDYFDGDRPLSTIESTAQGMYDAGLAAYFTFDYSEALRIEWYGVWRHEGDRKVGEERRKIGGRDVFTVGSRIVPRFTETFSGELEGALQFGETEDGQNIFAHMLYGALKWDTRWNASVNSHLFAAVYLLSGDDDASDGRDTNWNPLWARYPQDNEIYTFRVNKAYGMGYWTNFFYPHVGGSVSIAPGYSFRIRTGHAFTAQADGLGGGSGHKLGWLTEAEATFPIFTSPREDKRGSLRGGLLCSAWKPGDYFTDNEWAYLARFELNLSF